MRTWELLSILKINSKQWSIYIIRLRDKDVTIEKLRAMINEKDIENS